jgi:hypothetical protein
MSSPFDKGILILLLGILCSIFIYIIILKAGSKKEGFYTEITDDDGNAYDPAPIERVAKKTVKFVADILMRQQNERINFMRNLWDEEKRTKKWVEHAEEDVIWAAKDLAFALAALISLDPITVALAISKVAFCSAKVAETNETLKKAKEAHDEAVKNLNECRNIIKSAAEKESAGKNLDLYSGAAAARMACSNIIPLPAMSMPQ